MTDTGFEKLARVVSRLENGPPVERIELFRTDVETPQHFSYGTWWNRQHVVIRFMADGQSGWAETIGATNQPDFDLETFATPYRALTEQGLPRALEYVARQRGVWDLRHSESAEFALLDLIGRLADVPAVELLGLQGRDAVPALHCVLTPDEQDLRADITAGMQRGLRTHLKVKLFGRTETDLHVIRTAREVMGRHAVLIGDVNGGYGHAGADVEALAELLRQLGAASLTFCEDPARMSVEQWIQLQQRVEPLGLLPDEPMRPAWEGLQRLQPGMGRVFNLHPNCMGSVLEAVRLGRRIHDAGGSVMVGDASLIGPGCTMWQQLAIGLGAAWVEAIEKPHKSNLFDQYARSRATRLIDGRAELTDPGPGFGLTIDPDALAERSISLLSLQE